MESCRSSERIIMSDVLTGGQLRFMIVLKENHYQTIPEVQAAMQDENIKAFTSFSPIYRWEMTKIGDLCEVRLIDLTVPKQRSLSIRCSCTCGFELNVVNSYTGWIFSEDKLNKKLNFISES